MTEPITIKAHERVDDAVQIYLEKVSVQREEILTAFFAKYGCEPDEIVQLELRYPNGDITWQVMTKTEFEKRKRKV